MYNLVLSGGEHDMDPILTTLQLDSHTAHRTTVGHRWRNANAMDASSRLWYVESGSALATFHDRSHELTPGRLYLIPAHTPLAYACPEEAVFLYCHFTATVLGGMDLFACLRCEDEFVPDDPAHVERCLERLRELHHTGIDRPFEVDALLRVLLAPFLASARAIGGMRRQSNVSRFHPVFAHIEARLGSPLRLADLARLMHLEPTYFSRLFRRTFGLSPTQYLLRRRTRAVQQRLQETDDKLDAIAVDTGFCDAFHLSKTFRRLTGVSPSDFRKRASERVP
jgi:AraC-like DNA-binding protein